MITSIHLKGFQAHTDSKLELSPGVNVILGKTDTGKSAILRGLGWVVFNRPSGDSFVNDKSKETSVTITTDRGTVTRSRKPKNAYTINDVAFTAVGKTVPEEIRTVINLGDVNFQTQLDPYFLVLQTPGQISRYISEVLGFEVIDKAIASTKSETERLYRELGVLTARVEQLTQELAPLAEIDEIETGLVRIERQQSTVEELEGQHAALTKLIESIQTTSHLITTSRAKLEAVRVDGVEESLAKIEAEVREQQELETAYMTTVKTQKEITKLQLYMDVIDLTAAEETLASLDRLYAEHNRLQAGLDDLYAIRSTVSDKRNACLWHTSGVSDLRKEYINELRELQVCPVCLTSVDETVLENVVAGL